MIYCISAIFYLLLSFLIFRFSFNLDKKVQISNIENNLSKSLKLSITDILKNAKTVIKNKMFLLIIICTTCETFLIKGIKIIFSVIYKMNYF